MAFERFCLEIQTDYRTDMNFTIEAMQILQKEAENYMISQFKQYQKEAKRLNHKTVMPYHLFLNCTYESDNKRFRKALKRKIDNQEDDKEITEEQIISYLNNQ